MTLKSKLTLAVSIFVAFQSIQAHESDFGLDMQNLGALHLQTGQPPANPEITVGTGMANLLAMPWGHEEGNLEVRMPNLGDLSFQTSTDSIEPETVVIEPETVVYEKFTLHTPTQAFTDREGSEFWQKLGHYAGELAAASLRKQQQYEESLQQQNSILEKLKKEGSQKHIIYEGDIQRIEQKIEKNNCKFKVFSNLPRLMEQIFFLIYKDPDAVNLWTSNEKMSSWNPMSVSITLNSYRVEELKKNPQLKDVDWHQLQTDAEETFFNINHFCFHFWNIKRDFENEAHDYFKFREWIESAEKNPSFKEKSPILSSVTGELKETYESFIIERLEKQRQKRESLEPVHEFFKTMCGTLLDFVEEVKQNKEASKN